MAMEEVRKRLTVETQSSGLDKTASEINKVADAEARLAVTSSSAEKAQLSLDKTFANLERRYVDGVRQQQELAKVQTQVNAAVAQNPALQERANAVLAGATMRLNQVHEANQNVAKSTGLARYELINLSRQAQDVGVSLASGQSPFTVLVQQGSQIADVFASSTGTLRGFFSQAIGWAGRFATSAAGVATGVLGIGASAPLCRRKIIAQNHSRAGRGGWTCGIASPITSTGHRVACQRRKRKDKNSKNNFIMPFHDYSLLWDKIMGGILTSYSDLTQDIRLI